jgi:biopolymer transport protein ExbD
MDNLFDYPEKRAISELNLVPIIDMFTTVIFFLLLSTMFIAYTKLTVPPSKVSTITQPLAPPPLAATLLVGNEQDDKVRMVLQWSGKEPGHSKAEAPTQAAPTTEQGSTSPSTPPGSPVIAATKKLISDFHARYPGERTIRIAMARTVEYQNLISVMDAVREDMPDVVLVSYDEAEMALKEHAQ